MKSNDIAGRAPRRKRSPWIDGIRGLALVIISFNHLFAVFSKLAGITQRTIDLIGFVSMLEIFLLISGLAVAHVYLINPPPNADKTWRRKRIFIRAGKIYLAHMLSILFLMILTTIKNDFQSGAYPDLYSHLPTYFFLGLIFVFQPFLFDILPLYVILLCGLPWVLNQIDAGKYRRVLFVSAGLWLFSQFVNWNDMKSPYVGLNLPLFNPLACQLPFVGGIFLALILKDQKWQSLIAKYRTPLLLFCGGAAIAFFIARHFHPTLQLQHRTNLWVHIRTMGPVRLLNLFCVVGFAAAVAPWITRYRVPRPLQRIGKNSLWLYTIMSMLAYLWVFFLAEPTHHMSKLTQLLAVTVLVMTMPWMAKEIELFKYRLIRKRKRVAV